MKKLNPPICMDKAFSKFFYPVGMSKTHAFTLSEVFYPVVRSKTHAFTLSEVLIALAIIGVVAAITIPGLIANYQKKVLVTQLQKTIAVVENGFKLVLAKDGVENLNDTELFQNGYNQQFLHNLKQYLPLEDKCLDTAKSVVNYPECNFFVRDIKLASNLKKLNGTEKANPSSVSTHRSLYLKNGAILGTQGFYKSTISYQKLSKIEALGGKLYESMTSGPFLIDVNGEKKPNQFGRDIFAFILGNDGKLYTPNSNDGIIYFHYNNIPIIENPSSSCPSETPPSSIPAEAIDSYLKNREQCIQHYSQIRNLTINSIKENYKCDKTLKGYYGYYDSSYTPDACAQKIIEDGWKMNY